MNDWSIRLAGAGLVIGARARWDALLLSTNVRFVDRCNLGTLRREHPAWRSSPLAPVDIVDDSGTLASVVDASIDYIVDWSILSDGGSVTDRFTSAARVLRPGGLLVLAAYDSRFVGFDRNTDRNFAGLSWLAEHLTSPGATIPDEPWSFARFSAAISAFAVARVPAFEVAELRRHGCFNLALLRRRNDRAVNFRGLVMSGAHFYVLDGQFLRHITNTGALSKLRAAMLPMIEIRLDEQVLFVAGRPLGESDVAEFLTKTDTIL